tara:strand:+ start:1532 stop:1831 length:300 start_codon:yes stop_codon:yes gene_type:complete
MSKVNDSFHNICIVHDVFRGRVNEVVFLHLIKEREDIFTVDDCGNITHIDNKPVEPQTITATEAFGGRLSKLASEVFYGELDLDLEDYLTVVDGVVVID